MIRILHILYSFNTGGLENGLINLINHLPADKFFHIVCVLAEGKSSTAKLTNNNFTIHELRKRKGNDVSIPFKIAAIIHKEKVNIIHSRNRVSLMEGVAGSIIAGGTPVIHSEHGKEFDDLIGSSRLRHLSKKLCFQFVDSVITVSKSLGEELVSKRECASRKIIPIINGVDCHRFKRCSDEAIAQARKPLGIPEDKFVVGSVGRLAQVKNYNLMIELCHSLEEHYLFVLVGDGPERENLKQAVMERGLQYRFLFLGEISDVSTVLPCFDVFVNTSKYEGISNTILEAMASGVPVVANDVGGNRELVRVGYNGFLITNNNRDTFIEKIRQISSDPNLHRSLINNSRQLALGEFSLERMIDKYQQEYLRRAPHVKGH